MPQASWAAPSLLRISLPLLQVFSVVFLKHSIGVYYHGMNNRVAHSVILTTLLLSISVVICIFHTALLTLCRPVGPFLSGPSLLLQRGRLLRYPLMPTLTAPQYADTVVPQSRLYRFLATVSEVSISIAMRGSLVVKLKRFSCQPCGNTHFCGRIWLSPARLACLEGGTVVVRYLTQKV